MLSYPRPWFDRWVESATGAGGFWPDNVPKHHFRTSSTTGRALATIVAALLDQHPEIVAVLDIGAGRGELLTGLASMRSDLELTGVELRARPEPLAETVAWVRGEWEVRHHRWVGPAAGLLSALDQPTLIIAGEWLDDLPCVVAQQAGAGWRQVCVDDDGRETLGEALVGDDLAWLRHWWPHGQRAEIGLTRDRAWAELVAAVQPTGGMALMIDYGHLASDRPANGSLASYRQGRRVIPRPASPVNLTAHVAVDAVRAAGEGRGAHTLRCARQHEVVRELRPSLISPDPLADLAQRSQLAALGSPSGLGGHWWLLQH